MRKVINHYEIMGAPHWVRTVCRHDLDVFHLGIVRCAGMLTMFQYMLEHVFRSCVTVSIVRVWVQCIVTHSFDCMVEEFP